MIFIPKDYQRLMREHAFRTQRCALWAGMGMGKSAAGLDIADTLYRLGEIEQTLVVAPLRVARSTWVNEARKWESFEDISVVPVVGTPAQRKRAVEAPGLIHTINYEMLPWLIERWGDDWPYDLVIADESTRLKNLRISEQCSKTGKKFLRKSSGSGQRAAALAKIAHQKVRWWINLTGTPAPNGLVDLWGQQWFLDAGQRLGRTFTGFTQRWFKPNPNGYGSIPLPHADKQIHAALVDTCLTLDAKDYFDLEEPLYRTVEVDLPAKALRLYKQMEKEMFMELEGREIEAFNAASKTLKCLQIANGAAYIDGKGTWEEIHKAKLEALESVIAEAAGMPVIVAYHFKSDLARLKRHFKRGREFDTSSCTLEDFKAGRIPVLFLHPASAGHGVDGLQDGTNILVFFGHWWDLEQYQQTLERIGPTRQAQSGYDRPVWVYHLVARGTMDEVVMARRASKRSVQDLLLEAMKKR